jgi:hypothetical protein
MTLSPRARRLVLAVHVVSSIGWIGALAGFLVLSVAGVTSADASVVRGAYVAEALIAWYAVVPLALVSLATGIAQGLGTEWGLFRNYWVLFKLVIVVAATSMLLGKLGPIADIAGVAAESGLAQGEFLGMRVSIALHAAGGLLVLVWAAALGLYKPAGMTRHGWRKYHGPKGSLRR